MAGATVRRMNARSPIFRTVQTACPTMMLCLHLSTLSGVVLAKTPSVSMPDVIMSMKGNCERFTAHTMDLTRTCKGLVVNTIYNDIGRTGFYFVSGDVLVTFSGQAHQIKPDPDTAVQPLDRVIFSFKNKTDRPYTAVGTCRYTNPYAGPAHVDCHAETDRGNFDASFLSDGNPPDRIR